MGKKEAEGSLGRALVKQHNQMARLSKEKGRLLGRHNRRVLHSVTDVSDVDAVVEQADAAHLLYLADNPVPQLLVDRSYVVVLTFFFVFFLVYFVYVCVCFVNRCTKTSVVCF